MSTILDEAFVLLEEGARSPASPWRIMTLASIAQDGTPTARAIVLRGFDSAARLLDCHTDSRSAKYAELTARPQAALHGWDPARRIQLRLHATARALQHGAEAQHAWRQLPPRSRAMYHMNQPPGAPLGSPPEARFDASATEAQANFCLLRFGITALGYLHLEQGCHRRAQFIWQGTGWHGSWVAP